MKSNSAEQKNIQQFYDTVYYKEATTEVAVSKHLRQLAKKMGICEGQSVLDVACGTGAWLLAAQACGAKPAGIDLSSKAIDICLKNMHDGEFHVGPAETLPFNDQQFDIVTCLGSLEHFLEPSIALKEMVRVAKEDAIFLLLVPNADFLTRRLGFYQGTHQVDAKEEVRTLDEWQALFESADLQVKTRWKDLHVLSWSWISANRWYHIPLRAIQALALAIWPLSWQYQVYHLCVRKKV
jgi:ubiquinone/menaquinone biosynthesis C-methylase UbiE